MTDFGYKVIKNLPQDKILIVCLNIKFTDGKSLRFIHRTSNFTTPQRETSAHKAHIENRNLLKEKFLSEINQCYAPLNKKDKIKSVYLFYKEASGGEITQWGSILRERKSGAAPSQPPKPLLISPPKSLLLISPPKVPTLHPNQWLDYYYPKPFVELTFPILSDLVDSFYNDIVS
jgi:hypothetical protein